MSRASQKLHDLMAPALGSDEELRAEGTARHDETGNVAFVMITDRRILWRLFNASYSPDRFPLHELSIGDVSHVYERFEGPRCFLELVGNGEREVIFEFNRSDAKAAAALRQLVHERGIPHEEVEDFKRSALERFNRRQWGKRSGLPSKTELL
jgi:hypothetical protein